MYPNQREDIKEIIKTYNNGVSLSQLSRTYNTTPYVIKKILTENSVQIRTRKEQNKISNAVRNNHVKHDYFNKITIPNQAWLIGFLLADSWIAKDKNQINIELAAKDRQVLEDIRKELNIENKIMERITSNGYPAVRLSWSSGLQKDKLANYGVINNKTYKKHHLPIFKNEDLTYAFILGYYDGDGSFSNGRFRICAYRSELLQDIADFLNVKYYLCQDARGLWELGINSTYAIPILEKMYSLNNICLQRKKDKFLEYKASTRV